MKELKEREDFESFLWAIIRRNKLDQWVKKLTVVDEDDLFQKGWCLLEESRDEFEESDLDDFPVYAWSYILTSLIDYVRREESKEEHEGYQYKEGMETAKGRVPSRLDEFKIQISGFDKIDLKIIDLIGHNCTQDEIGDRLDMTQQAISKRINKIKTLVVK